MNLLIVEDNPEKASQIESVVVTIKPDAQITVSTCLADAVRSMEKLCFDLVILDFMLPLNDSGPAIDCSSDLLNIVQGSSRNQSTCIVALTAYDDLVERLSKEFADSGVIICKYDAHNDAWQTTIASLVRKHSTRASRRFAIICALDRERLAFGNTSALLAQPSSNSGLDVSDIEIGDELGVVVLCPRMGLVNASIVAALSIERFSPEIVCMPGICAGVSSESNIGQILIAHPCFEYQVGKYTPTGFKIEQYHENLEENLRQSVNSLGGNEEFVSSLYDKLENSDIAPSIPKLGTFVSGSAVVADNEKMTEIVEQHRKLAGLDMEAFGVMHAVALADSSVKAFSAKTVVDHADNAKGDKYHEDGCTISARFCVEAISHLLSTN